MSYSSSAIHSSRVSVVLVRCPHLRGDEVGNQLGG
jgi:hypothetical protein